MKNLALALVLFSGLLSLNTSANNEAFEIIDTEHGGLAILTQNQRVGCGGSLEQQRVALDNFAGLVEEGQKLHEDFINTRNPLAIASRAVKKKLANWSAEKTVEVRIRMYNPWGVNGKVFTVSLYDTFEKKYITNYDRVKLDSQTTLEQYEDAGQPYVFVSYDDELCIVSSRDEMRLPYGGIARDENGDAI